ncbi:cytochrome c oxidase assembly protein [Sinomonas sp. JGH33]|uniref:Cytochrome c oxidase assembly protein n=1 Tax=Sinomonas terricola TaxID=3110330 RepID=A0ABU5TCD2_9MICC|nr:cytochrome c oxidase assembly protein [Sinomonas sp. JGH33]MEA5457353.1 cytochrome c oxidase assembly protein [Sinomonas sp. JGH33]
MFSGAVAAREVLDPGALVRWGLPLAQTALNVSAALVLGGLAFAVAILPHRRRPERVHSGARAGEPDDGDEHPAFTRALRVASVASLVWTASSVAVLVLTHSDLIGQPLSGGSEYTKQLVFYMTQLDVGRAWLVTVIIAATVSTLLFAVRSLTGLALTFIVAAIGLVPMALIGHSASSNDHEGAVNSLFLHVLGAALWVGGIGILALLGGTLAGRLRSTGRQPGTELAEAVLPRFSALALFCFVLVVVSGIINASLRVSSWGDLFGSAYGQLVLGKVIFAVVLGGIGFMHRRWIIPQLSRGASVKRVLWQLVGVEMVVMGGVSGLAVALSRSAPPQPTTFAPDATPAFILSGYNLPPELTASRWLTEWRADWLWVAVAVLGAATYALGIAKLARRGDSWSWPRSVSWFVGLALLTYITSGPPAVYGRVLFSAHMVDHMMLTMVAPLFLVLGSPVTLALKALAPRQDGSRGLREWLLVFVHSRFSQLVTHPLFAAANFAGSIILFYYSDFFGYAMRDHVGHELMNLHFTLTGYIFVLTMIGSDPLPRRAPYPLRLLLLFATMAFHAFFGVAIMGSNILLDPTYFGNLGRPWGASAIADQQAGGAIAWGIGEIPTLIVAVGVAVMWSRSDAKETKRRDRAADRDHDAELEAYNAMFTRLQERDRTQSR